MPDLGSIGGFVAFALGMTSEAVFKSTVGEAVKDAYKSLKEKVFPSAAAEVAALETEPASDEKRLVLAEVIDRQPEQERAALRVLAEALIDELKAANQTGPIAIDIGALEAKRVNLPPMNVEQGIGFRAKTVKVEGEFTGGPLTVGKT